MKKGIIICEGSHEKHTIFPYIHTLLCKDIEDIVIVPKILDYTHLLEMLPVQIKDSERIPIGVIIDAAENIHDRWKSLTGILEEAQYSDIPDKPHPEGTLITDESLLLPDTGVWIMPDNASDGTVENFIQRLIPDDDDLIVIAKQLVGKLVESKKNRFSAQHTSKVELTTWLAWQKEPDILMKHPAMKNFLVSNNGLAQDFVNWFDRLLNIVRFTL